MDPIIARISHNLVARVTGPMHFRLLLQPGMATFFAIRDGLKDARECKPPYFWGLFTDKGEREGDGGERLEVGRKSVHPCDRARRDLPAHRAPVDRLSGRGSTGRDHSGHRALLVDPRTCQSNRLRSTQSREGTTGRRLEPHGNQLPNSTDGNGHDPPATRAPDFHVRLKGRSARLYPAKADNLSAPYST